jgi:hypothetical protein
MPLAVTAVPPRQLSPARAAAVRPSRQWRAMVVEVQAAAQPL